MMFTLTDHQGNTALMRDGTPFRYTSRALARLGKLALEAVKGNTRVFRVVAA
jgi:hypothetical protein